MRESSYKDVYKKADNIILVSDECLKNFQQEYPSFKDKSLCVENILSQNIVRKKADEELSDFFVDSSKTNFISVCRIVFSHKGLDRA